MLQYYFQLQYLRLSRSLTTLGIQPVLGVSLCLIAFVICSLLIFYKLQQLGPWIYVGIAVIVLISLGSSDRVNQIHILYTNQRYYSIRIIENLIAIFPFVCFLVYKHEFILSIILLILSLFLSFLHFRKHRTKIIPTPFRRFPFEYIIGFRRTFWVICLTYFVVFKSIQVDNYLLGLFAISIIFFVCMSYYQKQEEYYYLWIYTCTTSHFLNRKILISIYSASLLVFLPILAILINFMENWIMTVAAYLLECLLVGSSVVAKYSTYPKQMQIPQVILYAMSIIIIPLLPLVIWLFYRKSQKRLEPILEC